MPISWPPGLDNKNLLSVESRSIALANPTSVDDSATILAGLTSLGTSGAIELGPGVWRAKLGTIGSTTPGTGAGRGYSIRGAGPYKTILAPVDSTAGILSLVGPGNAASDFVELNDIGICLPFDMDYALPLIEVVLQKGMLRIGENVRFYSGSVTDPGGAASYTGTMLRLDGAYEGTIKAEFRPGKYAVPMEYRNTAILSAAGTPPNLDTLTIEGTVNGCVGHIFRDAYYDVHGLIFDRYKVTSSVFYASPPGAETTLAAAALVGATTIKISNAMVSGLMWVDGDVISIDYGDLLEVNKIMGVPVDNGDGTSNVTIKQPLRFAHSSGRVAHNGGRALNFGNSYSAITLRAFHFEGFLIGIGTGNVQGLQLQSGFNNTAELVRQEGKTTGVEFGIIESWGTPLRHTWLRKATYNVSAAVDVAEHVAFMPPIPPNGTAPAWYIAPTVFFNTGNDFIEIRKTSLGGGTAAAVTVINNSNSGTSEQMTDAFRAQVGGTTKAAINFGGRALFQAAVFGDVGNTAALTAAQIDSLANTLITGTTTPSASPLTDGLTVFDKTNKKLLTRIGTSWYPLAMGAAIV